MSGNTICPICKGKLHIFDKEKGWIRCRCFGEKRSVRLMGSGKFPLALINISSEDYKMNTPQSKDLGEKIKEVTKLYDKTPIFIYSPTNKKEIAAAVIVKHLIINHQEIDSVLYTKLEDLTSNFFNKEVDFLNISNLKDIEILVLSIGQEITNSAHRTILFNLIYDRSLENKMTIITSSYSKYQLSSQYLEKAGDLLKETFKFYEC